MSFGLQERSRRVVLATCGVGAVVVYEVLGLGVLRSLRVNLDKVWAFAPAGAGVVTLLSV